MLEDFYTCSSIVESEGVYRATMVLNATHDIFRGHFPDSPIVPGVCMLQMIKHAAEEVLGMSLCISNASQVKYTLPVNPNVNPELRLEMKLEEQELGVMLSGELFANDEQAVKLKQVLLIKE